jgi:hypothetical protein
LRTGVWVMQKLRIHCFKRSFPDVESLKLFYLIFIKGKKVRTLRTDAFGCDCYLQTPS